LGGADEIQRLVGHQPLYLVPERKLSFLPISASEKNLNPRNIQYIPAVKILIFLDLDEKS
jgi:hypothetical protein